VERARSDTRRLHGILAGFRIRPEDARMEWIAGFAWSLPRAFASAVSACRFEQGDVLVRDRADTGRWQANTSPNGPILQVLAPPKSTRAVPPDAEGSRFESNWDSSVTLDRYDPGSDPPLRIETTQGRLYTCLWRDALDALDPATPDPRPPRGLRELHRQISHAVPAIRARFKKRVREGHHQLFVFATDDASDAARVKARAMQTLLAEHFETESCTLSPAEAGVSDADTLRPSLLLCAVAIATPNVESIERRLASLLYGGASEDTTRFSLARHGHLTPLAPPPPPPSPAE
jgi:hypothetical protein